eukprot:614751-Prorocentrum_minimum.AAC.1
MARADEGADPDEACVGDGPPPKLCAQDGRRHLHPNGPHPKRAARPPEGASIGYCYNIINMVGCLLHGT